MRKKIEITLLIKMFNKAYQKIINPSEEQISIFKRTCDALNKISMLNNHKKNEAIEITDLSPTPLILSNTLLAMDKNLKPSESKEKEDFVDNKIKPKII